MADGVARLPWEAGGAGGARHVLVVGDVMLDEYVVGTVERISPEAPVPVVLVGSTAEHLGGAGNVARQVVALGGSARLVGVVGDDDAGRRIRVACAESGVDPALATVVARPSTVKQRLVVDRRQLVRVDRETTDPIGPDALAEVLHAATHGPTPDVVIVSDYAKGVVSPELLDALHSWAGPLGVPVLVDPKHDDFSRYRGAGILKANLVEMEAAIGRGAGADPVDTVQTVGPEVARRAGVDHLVVTLGGTGLVVAAADGRAAFVPAAPRHVFDVSGAGDTVIAVLALGVAGGMSVWEAAVVANRAGGLSVQHPGVVTVTAAELAREVERREDAVVDATTAAQRCAAWRAEGRRIVLTNGCFDLPHPGHLHLLRRAAELGDVLVVAMDTDASVASLKGPDRPFLPWAVRAAVVGSVSSVDLVVPFASEGLPDLVRSLTPDVLVKGGDYDPAQVVGGDWVRAHGGTVEIVPLLADRSTTRLAGSVRGD